MTVQWNHIPIILIPKIHFHLRLIRCHLFKHEVILLVGAAKKASQGTNIISVFILVSSSANSSLDQQFHIIEEWKELS